MPSPTKPLFQYEFGGTATVSVTCYVEAESEEQARAMVESGDCIWECDTVDGDVFEVEYLGSDEEE
jgi:hypothetical protein